MDAVTRPGESPGAAQNWTPKLVFSMASMLLLLEVLTVSYIMISMSIPAISAHFQTTQGAWLLTAMLLVGAVTGPLVGKLADMYGKRKLLLLCVVVATVGSLLSAVASSYAVLVAGRALSGVLIPCVFLTYSLIRDIFPPKTIALAVSIVTSGLGLVAIPAPFLTGWFLDNHGWRSIFWFFVIAMVVFGAMIFVSTEESAVRLRSKIDLLGAVLLGAGIAGVLVALSFGPTWGWTNGSTLAYLFGGTALLVGWLASAGMVAAPLVDLAVLRRRPVWLTAISSGMAYGCSALFTILLPMMAMTPAVMGLGYGFGVSAKGFAVFQAPIGGMVVVGGVVVGILVGRNVRPRLLMIVGLLMFSAAFVCTALSHTNKPLLLVFAGLAGTGMGLAYAAVPNLLIEAVPPQLQASTASIVSVAQSVIASVLPVIAFAVLNNSYIAAFPPEMTQGHTFYTDKGFQIAFLIGAVASGIGALLAVLLPRRIAQLEVPATQIADDDQEVAVVFAH
ncbi:MFS transporter [Nocardia sp. NBC_00565]|uniref:MFS transporter n=1 Tax=Nocardia sp. NBC_00565 TaxID=2975993 RepID=UPI002E812D66|nr:MFS transporter [Nocardia sp. NBC_00565]WUC05795.1 MFS transporter [Nocardia sp. NBC_00565]